MEENKDLILENKSAASEAVEAEKKANPVCAFFGSVGKTLARWFKRTFFGGANAFAGEVLGKDDNDDKKFAVEEIVSPGKQRVKAFLNKKLAMTSVVILVAMFLLVFIGPIFNPYIPEYVEDSQKNIAPGLNMMAVPGDMSGDIVDISSNSKFSVGIDKDGKVAVWGDLKVAGGDISKIPKEVANGKMAFVAAGTDHVIAIGRDGRVYGWGNSSLGQFGPSMMVDIIIPMPDDLLYMGINANDVAQLVCGSQVSAIVMKDGSTYMWGNYGIGALNMKAVAKATNVKKVAFTSSNVIALLKDGTLDVGASSKFSKFEYKNEQGETVKVDLAEYQAATGLKVVDIGAANDSVALVMSDGSVMFAGNFAYKENIMPEIPADEKIVSIAGGRRHYSAVTDKGNVYSWGDNFFGQSDAPKNIGNASKVLCGTYQNYALDANGKILAKWGLSGYIMGTDSLGRDIWCRILNGGRLTMTIGAISVIISSVIGIVVGCLSGYFGGWVDMLCMRLAEIVSSIPFMPFALILSLVVREAGLDEMTRIMLIMVVLGVLSWPGLARLVRAQVLSAREQEFVTAAKAMGVSETKIAFKHILPNVISIIIVSMTLDFAGCMLTESSLSYLGFGVQLPRPTWGNMLNGANNSIVIQNYWWQWVFPAVFLMITTICINIIGDALRDVMDPKSNSER